MKSYIDEINAFKNWLTFNQPTTSAIALWHGLMMINNSCGWKSRFNASYSVITTYTGLKKMAVIRARNSLIEYGLLRVYPRAGNQSTEYELISIASLKETQNDTQADTQIPIASLKETQNDTQADTQIPIASLKETQNDTQADTIPRVRQDNISRVRQEEKNNIVDNLVCTYFQKYVRPLSNIVEAEELNALARDYGDSTVINAIDIAVKKGKRNIRYIAGIACNLSIEKERSANGQYSNHHGETKKEAPVAGSKYKYIEG